LFLYLQGFYIASGVDTSILKDSNLPKTFLYGTYKLYMYYMQQNEIICGQVIIAELKRPWNMLYNNYDYQGVLLNLCTNPF
jgi:hypothetical protein